MTRKWAAALLLGTGLILLSTAHAAVASVTLPSSPDSSSSDLLPVPTTVVTLPTDPVPTTLPTIPVTVPSLESVTAIPLPADPPSTLSPSSSSATNPSASSPDTTDVEPTGLPPSASIDGESTPPPSASREVPLSFAAAARKVGPPFAAPILVIVTLCAYQLARASRDRRDHRLTAAVAEEQWLPFR